MQRKYHTYNSPVFPPPNAGVPMHSAHRQESAKEDGGGEILVPKSLGEKKQDKNKERPALIQDGRILGRFETDDIILLCIIFLILQNSDDMDISLLLALGYIFLSGRNFGAL